MRQMEQGGINDRNYRRFVRRQSRSRSVSPNVSARSTSVNRDASRSRAISAASTGVDYSQPGQESGQRRLSQPTSEQPTHYAHFSSGDQLVPPKIMSTAAAYDLVLDEDTIENLDPNHLPETFHIEALRAPPDSDSPVQLRVLNDASTTGNEHVTQPAIFLTALDPSSAHMTTFPLATGPDAAQLPLSQSSLQDSSGSHMMQFPQSDSTFDYSQALLESNQGAGLGLSSGFPSAGDSNWSSQNMTSQQSPLSPTSFTNDLYDSNGLSSDLQQLSQSQTMPGAFLEPFPDIEISPPQPQDIPILYVNDVSDNQLSNMQQPPGQFGIQSFQDGTDSLNIGTLFSEMTVGIFSAVLQTIGPRLSNAEIAKLQSEIIAHGKYELAQRSFGSVIDLLVGMTYANEVKAKVRSLQITHQSDKDLCRVLRQRDALFRQILVEKGQFIQPVSRHLRRFSTPLVISMAWY